MTWSWGSELAAAHGGKEGNFVAGTEGRVPGGEFLITGGDKRRAVFCELGIAGGIQSEKLFDGGGVGGVDRVFGAPDEIL